MLKKIKVTTVTTVITPDLETIGLYIDIPNNRKMFVMCVYKPPNVAIDKLLTHEKPKYNET